MALDNQTLIAHRAKVSNDAVSTMEMVQFHCSDAMHGREMDRRGGKEGEPKSTAQYRIRRRASQRKLNMLEHVGEHNTFQT